jgi:hypothetical protein
MLPRVAPTTGVSEPSPALAAGTAVDAAARAQPTAAALANLRAEVLLRLLETMLKHMPPMAEANPGRDLVETLLAMLKTMPGREGEAGQKLSDLIAKLPADLRPGVEKLVGTVLSAMPTRSLVEIVRNPNGPEAQKLATLLSASLGLGESPAGAAANQAKPLGLTAQQLAVVVSRNGQQQPAQALPVVTDARLLQVALKRLFDTDGGARPRPLSGQANAVTADHETPAAATRLPAEAARAEARMPLPAAATDDQPVEASAAALRHNGSAEELETPAVKREGMPGRADTANGTGQALARSVMQAVTRDLPPALLMQAVAHLVENLSPEEATFLRALLERPFDAATEQEIAAIVREQTEGAADPDGTPEVGKARAGQAQPAAAQAPAETNEPLPAAQAREAAQPVAVSDALPDRMVPAAALREGVPLAFVPYLPAEEDLEWKDGAKASEDEEDGEDGGEGENGEASGEEADGEAATEAEPESADMARRREKTAEMVGVIEPGLAFYQKLGDYWT